MKKHTLSIILTVIAAGSSFSQSPVVSWQHAFGGGGSDISYDLRKTTDGRYIVAGYTDSDDGDVPGNHSSSADFYVLKLDNNRNLQWSKNLGGSGRDIANSIRQTTDGGYIVAGLNESDDGDVTGHHDPVYQRDFWIVKLDASGSITWQKSLGGTYTDIAHCIQQTTDGGYIIAGETFSADFDVSNSIANGDYWIVKLDAAGNITWEKTYGGIAYDVANFIQQTKEGGYIVAGTSNSNDVDVTGHHGTTTTSDYWILKLNSVGQKTWEKSLGGTDNDLATSILQTKDDGFLISGWSSSIDGDVTGSHGSHDAWIVKLNNSGTIKWQHTFGGTSSDIAYDLRQVTGGGFLISGSSDSHDGDVNANHGNGDAWVFKITAQGALTWSKTYGGSQADVANSALASGSETYLASGYTSSYDEDAAGNHGNNDILVVNLGTTPIPYTITTDLSSNKICWEQSITVDYATTGTFNTGNIFTAEISDFHGSFVNSTVIGSVSSTSPGSINCVIPAELKKSSSYHIRVNSSNPPVLGGAFPTAISLKCKAPDGLQSSTITSTTADVNWHEGSCPIEYVLQWKPSTSSKWDSVDVNSTSTTLTDLIPETTYDWRVKETCRLAPLLFSDWSKKKNFTTAPLKLFDATQEELYELFTIFPNPTSGILSVRTENAVSGTLIVTNLLGEVLLFQQLISNETTIDVTNLPQGTYFIEWKSDSGTATRKFIRQ